MNNPLSPELTHHIIKQQKRCYTISFANYLGKHCEINNLNNASYKKVVEWVKNACLSEITDKEDIRSFKNSRYRTGDLIKESNNYSFLFKKVDDGTEIYELGLSGSNRMFYYFDDANMNIEIRLLKNAHIEDKKIKR